MKVTKYPLGVAITSGVVALMAYYNVFSSVGGTASVVICGLMLFFGWMAPIQIMRDDR